MPIPLDQLRPVADEPEAPAYPRRRRAPAWLPAAGATLVGALLLQGALWLAEHHPPPVRVSAEVQGELRGSLSWEESRDGDPYRLGGAIAGVLQRREPSFSVRVPAQVARLSGAVASPAWSLNELASPVDVEQIAEVSSAGSGGGIARGRLARVELRRWRAGSSALIPFIFFFVALSLIVHDAARRLRWRRLPRSVSGPADQRLIGQVVTLEGRLVASGELPPRFDDGLPAALATATTGRQGGTVSSRPPRLALELDGGEQVLLRGEVEVLVGSREVGSIPSVDHLAPEVEDRLTAAEQGALTLLGGRRVRLLSVDPGERVLVSGLATLWSDPEAESHYRQCGGRLALEGPGRPLQVASRGRSELANPARVWFSGVALGLLAWVVTLLASGALQIG